MTEIRSGNVILKAPILRENCDCSQAIENGQMIMLSSPFILYSPANTSSCSLVLGSCTDVFNPNIPQIIHDPGYFQHPIEQHKDLTKTVNKKENLEVLESCENIKIEETELTDNTHLTEIKNGSSNITKDCDILDVSDEDDVIFVKEYKENEQVESDKSIKKEVENVGNIRRNPVRNVRNKSKNLPEEILFEEDFAFLDTSDDELEERVIKTDKQTPALKLPKEWPINVHERPEYNAATNQIESFDYTIRDIQKTACTTKKPKPDAANSRSNNTKRKPAARRRKKVAPVPVLKPETVSLDELKPLINSTTDMLKNYFVNSKKHKDLISWKSDLCTFENKVQVLRNQAFLFAIVNNLDERQVVDKFKHLNLDNEGKS